MVFIDTNPIHEIDVELKIFRVLFENPGEDHDSLIISKGGTIVQHLVEFLARSKRRIEHNIYNSDFKDFLGECEFIPKPVKDFILIIETYRHVALDSKDDLDLNKVYLSFLENFNYILDWFKNFFHYEFFSENIEFTEIDATITFINRQIMDELKKCDDNPIIEKSFKKYDERIKFKENYPDEYEIILKIALGNKEMLNTIMQNQKDQTNQLNNIEYKIDKLGEQLRGLNKEINEYQENLTVSLENAHSNEEKDNLMSEFTDKCTKKIVDCAKKNIERYMYKQEEKQLIISLGKPAWSKLSEQSKTFLITSKLTYKNLIMLDDIIDYSGVCLLVTKALELELTKRFFKDFVKYLDNQYDKDYSKYHSSLLGQDPKTKKYYILKPKRCDLGRITYILGFNRYGLGNKEYEYNTLKLIEYSKHKLFNSFTDDEIRKTLYEYGSNVDKIRKNYRNPAAHTNELKQVDAEECFKFVLETEQVLKIMLDSFDK